MSQTGRVVLVTGCSTGGIGFSLCEEFAAQGCKVWATSRKLDTMVGFTHPSICLETLDVGSDEDVERVVKTIIAADGRIDVVVNNAGVIAIGALMDIELDQVQKTFDTNTFSTLRVCRAVFPHMAARKSGHIVNIGSVAGLIPTPWNGLYSASKAALHAITETLSLEYRPFGIKVTLVAPGGIKSNIVAHHAPTFRLPEGSRYGAYIDNMLRRMHTSQGRGSMPTADFAKQVVATVLRPTAPPYTYLTLGGSSTIFAILGWLPRKLSLWILWKTFSKGVKA